MNNYSNCNEKTNWFLINMCPKSVEIVILYIINGIFFPLATKNVDKL